MSTPTPPAGDDLARSIDHYFATATPEQIAADIKASRFDEYNKIGFDVMLPAGAKPSPEEAAARDASKWCVSPHVEFTNEDIAPLAAIIARHFAPLRAELANALDQWNRLIGEHHKTGDALLEARAELERVKGERDALEIRALGAEANSKGLTSTFELWQKDAEQLAAEFPSVEWFQMKDFIPHVRHLRSDLTAARTRIGELETAILENTTNSIRDSATISCLRTQLALANAKLTSPSVSKSEPDQH